MFGIAGFAVVCANVNAATCDDGGGMCFRAELGGPLDILVCLWVKGIGQPSFLRNHVAGPGLAPLRLVACAGLKGERRDAEAQEHRNQEMIFHS